MERVRKGKGERRGRERGKRCRKKYRSGSGGR